MHMFAGKIDHQKVDKLFFRALKKGAATQGNRHFEFSGTASVVETFYGKIVHVEDAVIRAKYFWSWIFCLDMRNKRVTNYNMAGYSSSTSTTLSAYEGVVFTAVRGLLPINTQYYYRRWMRKTDAPRKRFYYSAHRQAKRQENLDDCFDRFREQAPWMRFEDNTWWFYWDKYDQGLARIFEDSIDFLTQDQNWRYFTYHWENNVWTKKFIDADAERRWKQREGQHARAALAIMAA